MIPVGQLESQRSAVPTKSAIRAGPEPSQLSERDGSDMTGLGVLDVRAELSHLA
jgi:hypothetical protein